MPIPNNVIATADDFGLNNSVNRAILFCFEKGYINSTSFITNTAHFDESVILLNENKAIYNVGVHVNLAEGKPLRDIFKHPWIAKNGDWEIKNINKKSNFLNANAMQAFSAEIEAQIEKAMSAKINVVHLDSHYHLHTLPCFYPLFVKAAKKYQLKLRLAQTYNEGNFLKYLYRKHINSVFSSNGVAYSDYFETVDEFLKRDSKLPIKKAVEIMLHPDFDALGKLTDHYDQNTMVKWLSFLEKKAH